MNFKLEQQVARLRCENKSVKFISKKLSMRREDVEHMITKWILETDHYIEQFVSGHKVDGNPDPNMVAKIITSSSNIIPLKGDILDYVALNRSNHHDRIMDCIRYHLMKSINDSEVTQ